MVLPKFNLVLTVKIVSFISYLSNALSNPRAMVIKPFHTIVTYRTMGASRRTIKHASVAILHFHRFTINNKIFNAG